MGVGWATGGGAAQVLFSLYGELVFHRGPSGIGVIWSFAGIGLLEVLALCSSGHVQQCRWDFAALQLDAASGSCKEHSNLCVHLEVS